MDEKYLQALYKQGQTGLELGSYEEFRRNITTDSKYRQAFHVAASKNLDLGTYDDFETLTIGAKKKYTLRIFAAIKRAGRFIFYFFTARTRSAIEASRHNHPAN